MRRPTPPWRSLLEGRVLRLVSCWSIIRVDGAILRFTDHDRQIEFNDGIQRGVPGGTPRVNNGAGYAVGSKTLNVDGLMTTTGLYRAGDTIKFEGHRRRYTVQRTVTANGSGEVTITIAPGLEKAVVDNELVVSTETTFFPETGVDASAQQRVANLKVRNAELVGMICDDLITHADIKAGLYREATVVEFKIDWKFPHLGASIVNAYTIGETAFSGEFWVGQVMGVTRSLTQRTGKIISRVCQYRVFDEQCTLDPDDYVVSGSVTAINLQRLIVKTSLTEANDYFKLGILTWSTGLNAGLKSEIKAHANTDGRLDFVLKTPHNITVGDTFTVLPGCDGLFETCKTKFDNMINYGGEPYVPGTDKMLTTPDNK